MFLNFKKIKQYSKYKCSSFVNIVFASPNYLKIKILELSYEEDKISTMKSFPFIPSYSKSITYYIQSL